MDRVWDLFDPSQAELFNAIDELPTLEVASDIHGPQLVVVGNQSSGKSSVLEAIIREHFPVADGLCTRFPTKLIYRRSATKSYHVRIEPGRSRTDEERKVLLEYSVSGHSSDTLKVDAEVRKAAITLGVNLNAAPARQGIRDFTDDVLVIEKHGPKLPHVNLLDLPGLFISQTTEQGEEGREAVERMVKEHIGAKRSIVMLVISARTQYATQVAPSVVEKMLGEDSGLANRLIGVITGPDHPGLDEEEMTKLLRGQLARLKPKGGWYVVRNDNKDERRDRKDISDRDEREADFFRKNGFWQTVSDKQRGIKALMVALRRMVQNHLRTELPGIIDEVRGKTTVVDSLLRNAKGSRATIEDRREYLSVRADKFEHWTREAVDGFYRNIVCKERHDVGEACSDCVGFFLPFGDDSPEGQNKRLRSNIRMLNRAFASTMRGFGKTDTVRDDGLAAGSIGSNNTSSSHIPMTDAFPYQGILDKYYTYPDPKYVTRKEHEEFVAKNFERWRALEPNEEASSAACWGLLAYQSTLWPTIAENHLRAVWEMTDEFINLALDAAFSDKEVLSLLREHLIDTVLADMRKSSKFALAGLLNCRRGGNTGFYDGFADVFTPHRRTRDQSFGDTQTLRDDVSERPDDLAKTISDAIGSLPVPIAELGSALCAGSIGDAVLENLGGILWKLLRLNVVAGGEDSEEVHQTLLGGKPAVPENVTPARVIGQVEMYYQACMASFIGYVNALVIGSHILDELPKAVYTQTIIRHTKESVINIIAGEKEDDIKRREDHERSLASLQRILKILQKHERRQASEKTTFGGQTTGTDSDSAISGC